MTGVNQESVRSHFVIKFYSSHAKDILNYHWKYEFAPEVLFRIPSQLNPPLFSLDEQSNFAFGISFFNAY